MKIGSGALCATVLILLVSCGGGGSPTSGSSAVAGVVLRGTVLGNVGAANALSSVSAGGVTVTVAQKPAITTTVGADGTFMLRGLPEGSFTLVFSRDGVVLGTFEFSEVAPNQEITVTVRVTGDVVVLLEDKRNGIGHGDTEIEGIVESVLKADPQGESRFMIDRRLVVARPGETSIREGRKGRSVLDVTVGRQVHVKGVWLPLEGSAQPVLAHEILLQDGAVEPQPSPPPAGAKCFASGAKAEVEGIISAKGGGTITVAQQGKGDYVCEVSTGTRIRKGNKTYTFAELQVGWRVHVKGTGLGASGQLCRVTADEVMVQQN